MNLTIKKGSEKRIGFEYSSLNRIKPINQLLYSRSLLNKSFGVNKKLKVAKISGQKVNSWSANEKGLYFGRKHERNESESFVQRKEVSTFSQISLESNQNYDSFLETNYDQNNFRRKYFEVKPKYDELCKENNRLKTQYEEKYSVLKEVCQRLKEEQEQRDFLISKMEWKVKELTKELEQKY